MVSNDRANGGAGFASSYTDRRQVDDNYAFTNGAEAGIGSAGSLNDYRWVSLSRSTLSKRVNDFPTLRVQ